MIFSGSSKGTHTAPNVMFKLNLYILSSTANATLCLNLNNNFQFQSIHLLFGINVAKPFPEMPCEHQI